MKRKVISTAKAPKAVGPYSQGIRAGDTIYVPETALSRLRRLLPFVGMGVGIVTAYVVWETRR